ncbi:unnamed protein product [Tetraodon nigroviridis]|uniref:Chromosome undetermined SCAF14625, whole genome shotgun sequence n=1 Tax=Tetraodon nigroviridis TaxID=99883 RepID=Q4SE60_TETNG|nr:unnamed protein product [Tetraodon nigroviridis]
MYEDEEEGEEQLSDRVIQLSLHESCQESFLRSAARRGPAPEPAAAAVGGLPAAGRSWMASPPPGRSPAGARGPEDGSEIGDAAAQPGGEDGGGRERAHAGAEGWTGAQRERAAGGRSLAARRQRQQRDAAGCWVTAREGGAPGRRSHGRR